MGERPDIEGRPGGADLTRPLADAVWVATRADRAAHHHPHGHCPTRLAPYGTEDPVAATVHSTCRGVGCLDLHHELLARVMRKLDDHRDPAGIKNLSAYAYRMARTELVELKRAERTAVGFPAKPTRRDGAAGRVEAALEASGPDGAWLATLFRILRAYPFSPTHVPGRWPVDGLAVERGQFFPDEPDQPAAVRRDIATVLTRAADLAGRSWVYDNLTLPLNASGTPSALPESHRADDSDDQTHALMGRMLLRAYLRERAAGLTQRDALAVAARQVTGLGAPLHTRAVEQALNELEDAASGLAPTGLLRLARAITPRTSALIAAAAAVVSAEP